MEDYKWSEIKEICKSHEQCLSRDYFGKLSMECPLCEVCLDIITWYKENSSKRIENLTMIKAGVDIDEEDYTVINGVTVIADRYSGTWSGGKFTAWDMPLSEIPYAVVDNDCPCRDFWYSAEDRLIGIGDTPQEAYYDLLKKKAAKSETHKKSIKVVVGGKEVFEIDLLEPIPEVIEINKDSDWNDNLGLFAIMCIVAGNVKFNEENLKEIREVRQQRQGELKCL